MKIFCICAKICFFIEIFKYWKVINQNNQLDMVCTDFSISTFDKVDHSQTYSETIFLGIKWESAKTFMLIYLSNRIQYVCYNKCNSVKFIPVSGIPQGSLLDHYLLRKQKWYLAIFVLLLKPDIKTISDANLAELRREHMPYS